MKCTIQGFLITIVVVGICSSTNAEIVLQSAYRSAGFTVMIDPDGTLYSPFVETTEFGNFSASFQYSNPSNPRQRVSVSQTSYISENDIHVYGSATNNMSSVPKTDFSVTFSVTDHPQDFNCTTYSYSEYAPVSRAALYDLTHSQWIFANPGYFHGVFTPIYYGDHNLQVTFQITLPEGDYQLTGYAKSLGGGDGGYNGSFSINLTPVPEPSTLAMLLSIVAGGLLWRRRMA
jgi:hypothetical protein